MPMYAICPFFLYDKKNIVGCEHKTIKFNNISLKKCWMTKYCCDFNFENCNHAQMLYKKYNTQQHT